MVHQALVAVHQGALLEFRLPECGYIDYGALNGAFTIIRVVQVDILQRIDLSATHMLQPDLVVDEFSFLFKIGNKALSFAL